MRYILRLLTPSILSCGFPTVGFESACLCHLAFFVVLKNYVTHWSLLVNHLPTRLPWENSCAVPNPAYHMSFM